MDKVDMPPVEVRFKPKNGRWIALAPTIGVMTQGVTFEEPMSNKNEAVNFFSSCVRRGTLDKILQEDKLAKHEI